MKNAAIIVAAGSGKRFGSKVLKQFLNLDGKPVFLRSVEAFASIKSFKQIVVVAPPDKVEFLSLKYKADFVCAAGGNERFDSVKNGLALVEDDIDFIAVHDAARPLISKKDILSVLKKAVKTKAAIAVENIKDTVKLISADGRVLKTLDRTVLRNAQTPQIFEAQLLKKAYSRKISADTTDDSKLVENLKIKVSAVETKFLNFKITTKRDFELAEKILKF
ncbi:MAG: 2-C-methyl-D-erythritol 4-phosphate cytidylyltransferase [Endomicrobium sp.]|jgi:2-C-methyl-D-erythritol 4-phosphate cytidylyltransferase|nr:2-C-methyl-D-erythritol 4-phosphate cytidylyltransferase [Endomicrobium sp.]